MKYEAAIITTCKGRSAHLHQTLNKMIHQEDINHQVIIVDYGDPGHIWDMFIFSSTEYSRLSDRLSCVRVNTDTGEFNLSRARNFGAVVADAPVLAFVDADVHLNLKWTRTVVDLLNESSVLAMRSGNAVGKTGTCAVNRKVFETVRGYDESMKGWGHEEVDFYQRCRKHGKTALFDHNLLDVIEHSDEVRTEFYSVNKKISKARNAALSALSERSVNPEGYAQGAAMYFSRNSAPMRIDRGIHA